MTAMALWFHWLEHMRDIIGEDRADELVAL